jgi:thiosulfate dehydrogenase
MRGPAPRARFSSGQRFGWLIAGVVLTIVLLIGGAWVAIAAGLVPMNADARPSTLERFVAGTARHADTDKPSIVQQADPLVLDDQNLDAGIKLYGANCMVCHGASDGKPSNIATGLYQSPPLFGRHGVEDDPEGITHFVVTHGIRLTAMPAFDAALTDTQVWQLTMFLKHMDALPPAPKAAWLRLHEQSNPRWKPPVFPHNRP